MSAFWCEPFDQYPNVASMLNGAWAQIDGLNWNLSTANPRTGSQNLRFTPHSQAYARRVFGVAAAGAGVEYALYVDELPMGEVYDTSGIGATFLGCFLAPDGHGQVLFVLGTDGAIVAYTGFNFGGLYNPVLIARSAPCITAKAYTQIGLKVGNCSPTLGTIEARVNGVTVLNAAGVNTDYDMSGEINQILFNADAANQPSFFDIDDLHAWSVNAGDGPSDFVGNAAVFYRPPVNDTAVADWALFGGGPPAYPLLCDNNDATGISAATTGLKSAYGFQALPSDAQSVVYQQLNWRGLKTDAGDANVTPYFVSDSVEADGAAQPLTEAETWYWNIEAYDPATSGAPWTVAAANAAEGGFDRSL